MALQRALARLLTQFAWPVDQPAVDFEVALGGGGIGTFLTTLIVGAILIAFAPDWTRAKMQSVVDEPVASFAYGVVSLLFFALVILVLFVTIVGILFAVPLAIVLGLVWAVGATIAYLAIADRFVDTDDDWLVPLLLAAGMNGALTLTGIGGVVSFCVGAAGFGAVLRDYLG